MPDKEDITIENSMDLLLVLLFAPGKRGEEEPIEGITRLQKLIFLLREGKGPAELVQQAQEYEYKPYKMGPFSSELNQDIDELKSAGLLSTERLEYLLPDDGTESEYVEEEREASGRGRHKVKSSRFKLTDFGQRVAGDLFKGMSKSERADLEEFKSFFNSISLRQLLIFVYEKYPRYTTNSTIKKQLGL